MNQRPQAASTPGEAAPASRRRYATDHYELRIEGHLDERWSAWLGGLTLTREDDGTTTLRGPVTDQAELHGLLAKVRDLGTTLISVEAIDGSPVTNTCPPAPADGRLSSIPVQAHAVSARRRRPRPPRTGPDEQE